MKTSKLSRLGKLAPHRCALMVGAAIMTMLYLLHMYVPPGWLSWAATMPAIFVMFVTAVARLDMIGTDKVGLVWQARRLGLTLAASGAVMFSMAPFTSTAAFPSWLLVVMVWGIALTWLTTPDQPPWWKLITGEYRLRKCK